LQTSLGIRVSEALDFEFAIAGQKWRIYAI
jgi:hypothetical protein